MRTFAAIVIATLLSASCSQAQQPGETPERTVDADSLTGGWRLRDSTKDTELTFAGVSGPLIRLACSKGAGKLTVNVPAFTPIGSEDRLSFGGDGQVVALVADTAGDRRQGGVTGSGEIPVDLRAYLIGQSVSASYGAQTSGPHPAPPDELARDFLGACSTAGIAARNERSKPKPSTHPCQVQDGRLLNVSPMRAIGTEPFWAATIEGRCVTYSTPENQKGTRIWTHISDGPMGGIWAGVYQGKVFRLIPIPSAGCSDGMSDKVYPIAVDLLVDGEQRRGCAEPLKSG